MNEDFEIIRNSGICKLKDSESGFLEEMDVKINIVLGSYPVGQLINQHEILPKSYFNTSFLLTPKTKKKSFRLFLLELMMFEKTLESFQNSPESKSAKFHAYTWIIKLWIIK